MLSFIDQIHQGVSNRVFGKPLYIKRPLQLPSAIALRKWALDNGFENDAAADDMHITLAFSRAPVRWSSLILEHHPYMVVPTEHEFRVRLLGKLNAAVVQFDRDFITKRWQELRNLGCSWDFLDFHPHVTISYNTEHLLPSRHDMYAADVPRLAAVSR